MTLTAAVTAALLSLIIPGCTQNQDNSPISISNSQGRPSLYVACSTDGAIAYLTDGRNVYRYQHDAVPAESWACILSQGERLEMAIQHDPCEPQPTAGTNPKP
jgi:hypothetical protein